MNLLSRRLAFVLASMVVLLGARGVCRAQTEGTAFTYVADGFLTGTAVGLSTGYLFARRGGWNGDEDWKPLAYGAGIGALVGGGLGLTLGIMDMNRGTTGYGGVVLRDTALGAGFGALAGGIVGGLAVISSEDGEHVLLGASVGALVGAVGGMVLGIVEGNRRLDGARRGGTTAQRRRPLTLSVASVADGAGSLTLLPALAGRY